MRTFKTLLLILAIIALAIAYNIWLNAGCEDVGVMTWQGKKCIEI